MAENSELIELPTKLSTLKEKGLISAVEYRKIASNGQLVERELLKLLVSKYQFQGANIWKIFEVLAAEVPASATSENDSSLQYEGENEQDFNPLHETSKNPLLNNTISACTAHLSGFPRTPSAVKISRTMEGAVLVWEPPSLTNGNILEYSVYLAIKPVNPLPESKSLLANVSFVRIYRGSFNQCAVSNESLSTGFVDTKTGKSAIVFRIAAKNDKGYGLATQVRWLQAAEIPASVTSENDSSFQNEGENEQDFNPLHETSKNPLLINPVAAVIFEFLTFEEVKQCRLVCHQWDFAAQPLLRRKGIIHFKPNSLQPVTFLEVFEDKLRDLPFTSFKFSNERSRLPWSVSQLQMFFDKWGKNVKHLELANIILEDQKRYDVTPWLEKTEKLAKLNINSDFSNVQRKDNGNLLRPTPLQVELDKLKSVKYLHLRFCTIFICLSNKNTVRFKEIAGDESYSPLSLNEYINFSEATNIFLRQHSSIPRYCKTFSMASQELKADNVYLNNVEILNWNKAKGKIDSLNLFGKRLVRTERIGNQKVDSEFLHN